MVFNFPTQAKGGLEWATRPEITTRIELHLRGCTMRARHILFAVTVFIVAPMLWTQEVAKRVVNLTANQAAEIPANASMWMLNAQCDQEGAVYTQPFRGDAIGRPEFYQAVIEKITPGLKSTEIFRFDGAFPDSAEARAFFVQQDAVYVLATTKRSLSVLEFAKDGSIKTQTKLGIDFFLVPSHLAVFKSGEYLVVGLTGSIGETSPHLHTPFTGVFARDGHLLKRIYEPEDEVARQRAEGEDPQYFRCCSQSGNEFVGWNADATSGSDGNVYLLHGTSPLLVYAISPKGEILRKLQIEPGSSDLTANSIKFYAGHLAVGFNWVNDMPPTLIKVFDLNGDSLADYKVNEGAKDSDPILACYNAEGFTLLPRVAEKNLRLLTAKVP
jgi:hypothetical protein